MIIVGLIQTTINNQVPLLQYYQRKLSHIKIRTYKVKTQKRKRGRIVISTSSLYTKELPEDKKNTNKNKYQLKKNIHFFQKDKEKKT